MQERDFVQLIRAAGAHVYAVGGWVRDRLRGVAAHDKDYVLTGMSEDTFTRLCGRAFRTGNAFPVYRMRIDGEVSEIAFARHEEKTAPGYRGFAVRFSPDTTIEADLFRRDTTINSMAMNLETGEIIDPFGGADDVRNGIIRATSNHFTDDPVRALRAARQSAQFGFIVEPRTLAYMRACGPEIAGEPKERLLKELHLALSAPMPSKFFRNLRAADILQITYPQIAALIGVSQPEAHHPEGDAFEHTMQAVDRAAALTDRTEIRFAALAHDLGKALTPAEELPRHHRHDILGLDALREWNRLMTLPRRWMLCARFAIREHMRANAITKPGRIVDMLESIRRHPIGFDGFETVLRADGKEPPAYIKDRARLLAAMDAVDPTNHPERLQGPEIRAWLRERWIGAIRAARQY